MKLKKIVLPYFPAGLKYITPIFFGVAIFLFISGHPIWSVVLFALPLIILTTNYVTEINLERKEYNDYLSFLGFHCNKECRRFQSINRIIVTKGNYAQTVNTRVQSRQMNWSDFTATLIVDNGSLDLITRTKKRELLKELKIFSEFLSVRVEDCTTPHPFWVDMSKIDE